MAGFAPEVLDLLRKLSGYGIEGGLGHVTPFHVRTVADGGSDSNDGLSWAKAFAHVQTGLDAVGALEKRGKGVVLVGPGAYTEDLSTPLDADGPFGMLLGVSPAGISRGGVYLSSVTPARAVLVIRARGWKVSGFEIGAGADGGCIDLDCATAGCRADYAEIIGNLLGGEHQGLYGINLMGNVPLTTIAHNDITSFKSNAGKGNHTAAANNGTAIISSGGGVDIPSYLKIIENTFWDNENHIWLKNGSMKESVIRGNNFIGWGDNNYARRILEFVTGTDKWHTVIIEDNHGEGFQGDIICQQKFATIPADATIDIFNIVGGPIEVVELGWECMATVAGAANHQFLFVDHAAAGSNLCAATAYAAARVGEVGLINGDITDNLQVFVNGLMEFAETVQTRLILEQDGIIRFLTSGAGATGTLRFFIRYRKMTQSAFVNIA